MTAIVQYLLSTIPWFDDLFLGYFTTLGVEYMITTLDPNPYSVHGAVVCGGIVVVLHPAAQWWRGETPNYGLSLAAGLIGVVGAVLFLTLVA